MSESPPAGYYYRQEERSQRWHIVPDGPTRGFCMRYALCGFGTWHGCNAGSMRLRRNDPPGTCPSCAALADGVQQLTLVEVAR
jgi:hypothetical protein